MSRIFITVDSRDGGPPYEVKLATNLFPKLSLRPSNHLSDEDILELKTISESIREEIKKISAIEPANLENAGENLFRILFGEELKDELVSILGKRRHHSSKILLRVPEELASIWWELLYFKSEASKGFLFKDSRIYLSRFTGSTLRSKIAPDNIETIKVLVVASQPKNLSQVNAHNEIAIVKAALAGRSGIDLQITYNPNINKFKDIVLAYRPHLLHFVGHAQFNPTNEKETGLIFADKEQNLQILSPKELVGIVKRSREHILLVLNACETATIGYGYDNSVIGELVNAGVMAVIGMQCSIPNHIGLLFADSLYTYLLNSKLSDGRNQLVDRAMNEVRLFIDEQTSNKPLLRKYWCVPVLYTRTLDGVLFRSFNSRDEISRRESVYNLFSKLDRLAWKGIRRWLEETNESVLPGLAFALYDENPIVRQRAAVCLEKLNSEITDHVLVEKLLTDRWLVENDKEVKEQLQESRARLAKAIALEKKLENKQEIIIKIIVRFLSELEKKTDYNLAIGRNLIKGIEILNDWSGQNRFTLEATQIGMQKKFVNDNYYVWSQFEREFRKRSQVITSLLSFGEESRWIKFTKHYSQFGKLQNEQKNFQNEVEGLNIEIISKIIALDKLNYYPIDDTPFTLTVNRKLKVDRFDNDNNLF